MLDSDRDQDYWYRAAATGRFRRGAPRSPLLVRDGEALLFVRSADGRTASGDLWMIDTASGAERLIAAARDLLAEGEDESLPAAERARRERARESGGGITEFSASKDGSRVAFALGGRLFTGGTAPDDRIEQLHVPGPVVDPRLSPDGASLAWHAGGRLWVLSADGASSATAISPDDGAVWGLADFIAAEELDRGRGYWWAPDGSALLVARVDDSAVAEWVIADPSHPQREPRRHRYPAAGRTNATVELWHVPTGRTAPGEAPTRLLAVGPDHEHEYLATVAWGPHGALALTLTRDQRECSAWAVTATGAVLRARWSDDSWVDVVAGVPAALADGRLLTVRRDAAADRLRLFIDDEPASPPDLGIRSVLAVESDEVLVRAAPRPGQSAVYSLSLPDPGSATATAAAAATATDLSGPGWFTGMRRGRTLLLTGAGASEYAPSMAVRRLPPDGSAPRVVTSRAEHAGVLPEPEFHSVGEVRYAVLWPSSGPRAGLPILMAPYGGPHAQRVMDTPAAFLDDQARADQGYAVVVADGRGSPGGSTAWERAIRHDLLGPPLADQVAALDDVVSRYGDAVDPTRVGIVGWSFGGYLSAHAVLARPDRFTVAVAGAPVTEWRLYDTAYTERYLGNPRQSPGRYDDNSLLPLAGGLERPLMLIHGLADDNVVVAHTLHLSSALLAAGRPHTVLPLTGITHMTPQPVVAANLALLQNAFLAEHLRPAPTHGQESAQR